MIIGYEDSGKATFDRISLKTLDHLFLSQVEVGANCPPFVSNAILDVAKRVYHLDSSIQRNKPLKPGQYRVIGILSSEPAGKPLKDCRKGQCTITLDTGQEDRSIRAQYGLSGLRRARLLRICAEACEQSILLSQEDIAYNILNCGVRTVARDIQHYRDQGISVPTRGQQKDIGPGISHKVMAVKLLLDRHHPVDIARRLYHSLKAVERYTECFARLISLIEQGLNVIEIAFVMQISQPLAQQYLDLYHQYDRPEHRQRLDEIIGKATGVNFKTPPESPKKSPKEVQ
jgi:hypothetical protein